MLLWVFLNLCLHKGIMCYNVARRRKSSQHLMLVSSQETSFFYFSKSFTKHIRRQMRASLRTLRTSSLSFIGESPHFPCVDYEVFLPSFSVLFFDGDTILCEKKTIIKDYFLGFLVIPILIFNIFQQEVPHINLMATSIGGG